MIIKNETEIKIVAETILKKTKGKNCVLLNGNLGVGKTTLVKYIAKELSIKNTVTSPTFVIMKEYKIPRHPKYEKLIHIDAYRLKDKKDIKIFDIDKLLANEKNLVFIEWPEKIFTKTRTDCIKVNINYSNKKQRGREIDIN